VNQGAQSQDNPKSGYLYVDGITEAQQYIKAPDPEGKAALVDKAVKVAARAILTTTEGINRAKQEGQEAAFFYDPGREIYRLHRSQEITREEYDNNPARKAYYEYVLAIKFRFSDLSLVCSIQAITAGDKPPTYKRGLGRALKYAKKYIKQVYEATGCTADIAKLIAWELIRRVICEWYDIYHPKQFTALRQYLDSFNDTTQAEDLDGLEQTIRDYYSQIYSYDKLDPIVNEIIKQIYGAEAADRYITAEDTLQLQVNEATAREIVEAMQQPQTARILELLPAFHTIKQGSATNKLARMKTRITDPVQLTLYGDAIIKDKDLQLFIRKYSELANGIKQSAMLLLDALVIKATEGRQGDPLVRLPLKEYMEMRGLKLTKGNTDRTRGQVHEDLDALSRAFISFTDKKRDPKTRKYKNHNYLDVNICDAKGGTEDGVIIFKFGATFYDLLQSYPVMPYPKEILTFNLKYNPHSPRLLRRITEHKNMNYFHPNGDIISVQTLLEACPELPKYSELGEAVQTSKRIMDPFARDLDAIKSIKWHYCGAKGAEIDPPLTYADFAKAYIKIIWLEYPERKSEKKNKRALN